MIIGRVHVIYSDVLGPGDSYRHMVQGQDGDSIHYDGPQLCVDVIALLGIGSRDAGVHQLLEFLPVEGALFIIFLQKKTNMDRKFPL